MKNIKKVIILVMNIIICAIIFFVIFNNINKEDSKAAIDLYKKIIDNTLEGKTIGNKYIAITLDNLIDPLNEEYFNTDEKNEILQHLKKYSDLVYNDTKIPNENGYLIKVYLSSKTDNKANIIVTLYTSENSSVMKSYIASYNGGKWDYILVGVVVH